MAHHVHIGVYNPLIYETRELVCLCALLLSPVVHRVGVRFESEIEGGKLRRDVLAEGSVGSGPVASGIASLLSGQEEMFAFRRAVNYDASERTIFVSTIMISWFQHSSNCSTAHDVGPAFL
ncbi:hypothetical protein ACLOJK_020135 [Asimina triloba]